MLDADFYPAPRPHLGGGEDKRQRATAPRLPPPRGGGEDQRPKGHAARLLLSHELTVHEAEGVDRARVARKPEPRCRPYDEIAYRHPESQRLRRDPPPRDPRG